MEEISSKDIRDQFSSVLNKVAYSGEKFTLTRHGRGVAVLISLEEWKALERLLEKIEDEEDITDADIEYAKYAREGGVPFSKIKKDLGLE